MKSRALLTRHSSREMLGRHRHAAGYCALVLEGGYVEAGDRGRLEVGAGHVVMHAPYESHRDTFSHCGAIILNLPCTTAGEALWHVTDADAVVRLAEQDVRAACELLEATIVPDRSRPADWVDSLASDLISDPGLRIGDWAARWGITPQSVSRGFAAAFDATPKRFRADQRALKALKIMEKWLGTGAALAAEAGYADQAHMTRSLRTMTGLPPSQIRANICARSIPK